MSEQVHVMIVEDESIVAMDLAAGLEHDGYNVVGVADNFEDAIQLFSNNAVDILLMDINIHGEKDGVETATALMKIRQVPLIYLTAFTDAATVARVKDTNPAAFLTKPYSIDNVRIAIDLALHHFAEMKQSDEKGKVVPIKPAQTAEKKTDKEQFLQLNDQVFIKQNYRFVKFRLSDIQHLEADNNYVHIYTSAQKLTLRIGLTELLERMAFPKLFRVHRSYAVNLNEITSFDDQLIKVGAHEIPIGRNFRQDFLEQFNLR
ncbi:MAG: response regulator [Chitinophagaceae bacterium]|nr:response regulator [Chitinophagaceae bacterium]